MAAQKKINARKERPFFKTGIKGLDSLLGNGIPSPSSVLIAGGTGSGKTTMCLNILNNSCLKGMRCLYMSFEESEDRLRDHMNTFEWKPEEYEKKGLLCIERFNLFEISRTIEGLLMKEKGELAIDINPILIPKNFKPQVIVVDSLTAIASTFTGREQNYRAFIEQLFRFFEKIKTTSFLITETKQIPDVFSPTGIEEFLADGVIVMYNYKKGYLRQPAIEVLKMRGIDHQKKTVAMKIVDGKGIEIYPSIEIS